MANVLTTGSLINCLHTGTATLTSSAKLTVSGNPVLLQSQVTGFSITGCTQVGSGLTPCKSILTVTAGVSTKLTVGGDAVLLDSLAGASQGNSDQKIRATAEQNKPASAYERKMSEFN